MHKKQISAFSSPLSQLQQREVQPLTKKDLEGIEKNINLILENFLLKPNDQNNNNNNIKVDKANNNNTNSITLDFPALTVPPLNNSEHEDLYKSPLLGMFNHTYPNTVVDLVNKLNKILIRDYFEKLNPMIPVVDIKRFNETWKEKTKHSLLLINSILAISAARLPSGDDISIQKSKHKPGGVFFDAAKELLDSLYDDPRLETIQALLLLLQAESSFSRLDSAFMFLGMAVQMTNSLGLLRVDNSLTMEEKEERSRVFYCVYTYNRWMSFILGKPYSLDDSDIDVPFPTMPNFDRKSKDFFISFIKLSRILGEIWKFGYSVRPKANYQSWQSHITDSKSTLRQLRSSLAKCLKELPDDLQYQYLPNTDPRSFLQLNNFSSYVGYINIMFHACIILLHQPYINTSLSSLSPIKHKNYNNIGPIEACLTAATTITDIFKYTRKHDKMAFTYFRHPFFCLLKSMGIELLIMNASSDYAQEAKQALADTLSEFKAGSEKLIYYDSDILAKELEEVSKIVNGQFSISLPMLMQILELHKGESGGCNNNSGNGNGGSNINNKKRSQDQIEDDKIIDTGERDDNNNDKYIITSLFDPEEIMNDGAVVVDPMDISAISILILSWCDTAASVVGRKYGKYTYKFSTGKTLAGTLGAIVVGTTIGLIFWNNNSSDLTSFNYNVSINDSDSNSSNGGINRLLTLSLLTGVIGGISELVDVYGLDDNLVIPIFSGSLLWLLLVAFGFGRKNID
ncbi:19799_t:CDS:2 [Entrophospora sp. SA101]|nr:19799_t:CDS:2 [Entrophospora sp. SA101]